jgi:threonine dehydrogenase-like Zn-dependent dehydrogenase
VLVIGGGSIGLLAVSGLRARGVDPDLSARHAAQRAAGDALGASLNVGDDYDIVIDAAGTQGALDEALQRARPGGSVLSLGTFWEPVKLEAMFGMYEVSLIPAATYGHHHGRREFVDALDILAANPDIADVLVTHTFTLDEAPEAFRVAGDRAAGALKVILTP